MGWSSGWSSRSELVKYLREMVATGNPEKTHTILAERSTHYGKHLWMLVRIDYVEGSRWRETYPSGTVTMVFLFLLDRFKDGAWGYKDLQESMGPTEVDCPLDLIEKSTEHVSYAPEWRERVREYHEARTRTYEVGDEVLIYGKRYRITAKPRPRRRKYRIVEINEAGEEVTGWVYADLPTKMRPAPPREAS